MVRASVTTRNGMTFTTCAESFIKLFEQLEGIDYVSVDAQDMARVTTEMGGMERENGIDNTGMLADTAGHN